MASSEELIKYTKSGDIENLKTLLEGEIDLNLESTKKTLFSHVNQSIKKESSQ
jgi:hypothetical protein